MGAFSIDGIVSGLDTTSLINALISAEAGPQRLLTAKRSQAENLVTAWQSLNTKIAALATQATSLAEDGGLQPRAVTSSHESVTASATAGAATGELTVTVESVARSQSSVTAAMAAWATEPAVLTVRAADGTLTEITATSTDLDAVVAAINTADAGVRATTVAAGTDATTGEDLFRLQLTATETGLDAAFEVFTGTAAQVQAGTAADLFAQPGAAQVREAADAVLTLWAGTAAEQQVTSTTNTFANLMPGVDITVLAPATDPVTISVGTDETALQENAAGLVDALATIFAEIAQRSRTSSSVDADGRPVVSGGLFSGDSAVRDISARLLTAATAPVDGRSPSEVGISITRDGTVEFDAEAFEEALTTDPDHLTTVLSTISTRVAEAAEVISAPTDGLLTARITSTQDRVVDLGTEIADWDRRIELKRATLERTFTAMEVALARLQSQQSYLTSQLASLSTGAAAQA